MRELRRDPIVGQWVVVYTRDFLRPQDYRKEDHTLKQKATCQFCPGREAFTPPEVDALRLHGSHPNSSGWQVRVVSNKFPALRIEGQFHPRREGVFHFAEGIGAHEVVIETPAHDRNLADLTDEEMTRVIQKYQNRVIDLTRDRRFKYIIVFKNYGESAGTSVEHPHSQIIALPMIPQYVLEELQGSSRYYARHKRCVYCDIVEREYRDQERIIAQNDGFVAFCPFVPRYAFECWVLPKAHGLDFAALSSEQTLQLSQVLRETLYRLKACLSDPSYNYYFHISPVNQEKEAPHGPHGYHWHIEIVPNLVQTDGFEWGTGFYIVHTPPQEAARCLREIRLNPVPDPRSAQQLS